jgi:hypothetical protein
MSDTSDKPLCLCGCGEQTKGGEFRPGHDARYKSQLLNEAADGRNPEAEEILRQRGWLKFLDKRREILARPKADPKPTKADTKLTNLAVLCAMRAAAKVLKHTNQYKRTSPNQIAFVDSRRKSDRIACIIEIVEFTHPDLDRTNLPDTLPSIEERARLFGWVTEETAAVRSLLAPSTDLVID